MAKFFGNLHLVLLVGLAAAIGVMYCYNADIPVTTNSVLHWVHSFMGVLWIGLLYYLNFVQVPTMPKASSWCERSSQYLVEWEL